MCLSHPRTRARTTTARTSAQPKEAQAREEAAHPHISSVFERSSRGAASAATQERTTVDMDRNELTAISPFFGLFSGALAAFSEEECLLFFFAPTPLLLYASRGFQAVKPAAGAAGEFPNRRPQSAERRAAIYRRTCKECPEFRRVSQSSEH